MIKYIIEISYDGSKFEGLQKLKDGRTIQKDIEDALSKLDESPVKLLSSGRTDKGVHAHMQVCTFELHKDIDPYRLRYYIDKSTSKYLYIKKCDYLLDNNFHPRFSVKSKTYKYLINTGTYDPIRTDYIYNYNKPLDSAKMQEAAKYFLGTHDYRAFVIGSHKSCESTIFDINIMTKDETIEIDITGIAFYTYMVRNIVAALIFVGSGTLDKIEIAKMLDLKKKTVEFAPAPPSGLYLKSINY